MGSAANRLVVSDDLADDEGEELLGELRIQVGVGRQLPQAGDLALFAHRISRREVVRGLEPADALGVLEPFGEQVNERGIDVVDARAEFLEFGTGLLVWFHPWILEKSGPGYRETSCAACFDRSLM